MSDDSSIHCRTTPRLRAQVRALAEFNHVSESTLVEWALIRLLHHAHLRGGPLVDLGVNPPNFHEDRFLPAHPAKPGS